jgi:hypothetical protein
MSNDIWTPIGSSEVCAFTTDKKVTIDALWHAIAVLEAYEINTNEQDQPYDEIDRQTVDELLPVVAFLRAEVKKRQRNRQVRQVAADLKTKGYDPKNPKLRAAIRQAVREQGNA